MHRINGAGATGDNKFTEGDPSQGVQATTVTAAWLNAVQEELAQAIEQLGLALSSGDDTQLWQALQKVYGKTHAGNPQGNVAADVLRERCWDTSQSPPALYIATAADGTVGGTTWTRLVGAASTTLRGQVELATNAETKAGTDIQRAARFFYLQKQSFGARVDGQSYGTATTTGPRLNLLRLEEDLSQAHVRLHGAYIENLPWQTVIERYDRPHTMHYLDPPYWQTEGYGPEFPWSEYERMADLAGEVQGPLLISLNDHPDVRSLFEPRCHVESTTLRHTVGGGAGKEVGELLIWNDRCEQLRPAYGSLDMFAADGVQ